MTPSTIPAPPPPPPEPGTLSDRLVRLEADAAELRRWRKRARAIFAEQLSETCRCGEPPDLTAHCPRCGRHRLLWHTGAQAADCVGLVRELAEGGR